jgi:hypothetical protein
MKKIWCGLFPLLLWGCTSQGNRSHSDFVLETSNDVSKLPTSTENGINIKVESPLPEIKASELIAEYKYIPLETKPESFMGQLHNVIFYEDYIYVHDIEANIICIFDRNGQYLNKVGVKGDGPGEFTLLLEMTIDPFAKRMLVYDMRLRKILYFSLKGDYLFSRDINLRMNGDFQVISPNQILTYHAKSRHNVHLGEMDSYRIIMLDSLLKVSGYGHLYDDNVESAYSPPVFPHSSEGVLYNPIYTTDFYSVTSQAIDLKYHIDYSNFANPINPDKVAEMSNSKEIMKYLFSSTYTLIKPVETSDFFCFRTYPQNYENVFYTYYDKQAKRHLSFRKIIPDIDFAFNYILSNCDDYMVAEVNVSTLKALEEACKEGLVKGKKENMEMIEKLKDDDNSVLVLFKLKPLKRYE